MEAQPGKVSRRRRKGPPRRIVPAVVEHREQKPIIFGWGADLTNRERESLKEKIALIGGIGIAVIVGAIIGWGLINDNIIQPANQRAADNKPIATIGNYTVRTGFFKRFEQFRSNQFSNQIQQLQQEQSTLQAQPKQNAAQLQQIQQELNYIQQQQGNLASDALNALITNETVLQRSQTLGIKSSPKIVNDQWTQLEHQLGGKQHLRDFIAQSGLTHDELQDLLVGSYLQGKVSAKVKAAVAHSAVKIRASHILIASKNHALALKLYHEVLKNPSKFASLAKKYSTDPGSGKKGGDLGFFAKGVMVAPFEKAAFSMKIGQIKLVQSQFGWHIIMVTGRKKATLTPTEYQTQQNGAFQNWLNTQEAALHIQHYVSTASLPAIATPTANALAVPTPAVPVVTPAPIRAPAPVPHPAPKAHTGKKP